MVDTVTAKYVYPPNFAGTYSNTDVGNNRIAIHLTGISDGTNESDVVKVDKSALQCTNGATPTKLVVEKITYSIHGMTVLLEWDNTSDETIVTLNAGIAPDSNSGQMDWIASGGLVPSATSGTGDIILTSSNGAAGDSYDITLTVRLKE